MTLEVGGAPLDVAVRVNARARSYRLRLGDGGRAVLTVPEYGKPDEARAFLDRNSAWLEARLNRAPKGPALCRRGADPFTRCRAHDPFATGRVRGTVVPDELDGMKVLYVPGAPEHLGRRLTDWLKEQAKADLHDCVGVHAANLGVRPTGMSLRDQSSRWGSCSSRGRLNFNWRLIMAPPFVLDYVAAHEVAHMREMNHSPAFWAEVERTLPDYAKGRAWLKSHGRELMVYGLEAG